jgi:two-component system sensor histidine kinase TctE
VLRPLARLAAATRERAADDLAPLDAAGLPADVLPLVDAVNRQLARSAALLEQRRRFVDDASHQLRTPLTTLATQVGFALRETDPAAQRRALSAIENQLEETVRQTNQMLLLARTESAGIEPERVDLGALVQDVARRWWSEARVHGIDLGLEAPAGSLAVDAQPALLQEALSNLLHNAIRYTPGGGRVTLELGEEGGRARICVVDSGPGIPADELARAGERFFRGSNVELPGSGLGLAIVRSIAERFGGQLQLAPATPKGGLCATILLPLAPGDVAVEAPVGPA